ncbi:P1 family peptidase [Nocardia sp. CA2R105]|uniref:P1 family peptidase n=1 Tax=Nocardia coffeae TaxID=2873381 RepID=UPI001CA6DA67|nr:P1 family peptidase [Nocardia coffeae]MBY8855477.1 P1 family peptidase [Nocardia coffeae]
MTIGIPGIRVGHWSDPEAQTGCTVLTLPEHTTASCEVRGGAPASRELDALAVDKAAVTIDAIVLTGGSAFGLAAADGVLRYLEEQGRGVPTPAGPVPLVPTMALFDLAAGDPSARPTPEHGYAAAQAAAGEQILHGRVGAGTGAYTSQWRGAQRRPGGIGYAERTSGPLVVGALCAVNAFGDIDDGRAEISLDVVEIMGEPFEFDTARTHTTIGAVLTNARLDKTGCLIAAQGAHDGLARALTPPHTRYDGDGFIAAATGSVEAHIDTVRLMAVAAVAEAIRSLAAT